MNDSKKVSLLTKINYIFDRKQKGQIVILAVLILIGGVVETLGVSMMIPVISVILKNSFDNFNQAISNFSNCLIKSFCPIIHLHL